MGKNVPTGIRLGILGLFLGLSLLGCQSSNKPVSQSPNNVITFIPMGVYIELKLKDALQSITVFDFRKIQVGSLTFSGQPTNIEKVYLQWLPGETYRFRFQTETQIYWQEATAPMEPQKGHLKIGIPFLSSDEQIKDSMPVILTQKSKNQMIVQITNGVAAPATFHLKVEFPGTKPIIDNGVFVSSYQKWHAYYSIEIPSDVMHGQIMANLQIESTIDTVESNWSTDQRISFRVKTIEQIHSAISIENVHLPTDIEGLHLTHLQPDSLTLFDPFVTLLPRKRPDNNSPLAFQTIHLRNELLATLPVLVSATIQDRKNKHPILFLSPPSDNRRENYRSFSVINLEPSTTTAVSLPIYLNPNLNPKAGNYHRKIQVQVWGGTTILDQTLLPLKVRRPNRSATIVTILVSFWTLLFLIYLIVHWQILLTHFSNKNLILISLFGATIFGFVNLPATFLISISNFVLGPFSFLITGFLNEILYFTLLVALLTIVPKTGTIILVSTVRFLLNGILLGAMSPTILVYIYLSATGLEIAFWLANRNFTSRLNYFVLALFFGFADATSAWIDFQLGITFYRLFYADWYIWLMVGLGGFLYTFVGVLLGCQLGRHLQHVVN